MKKILFFFTACTFSVLLTAQNNHRLILLQRAEDISMNQDSAKLIKSINRLYKTNSLLVKMNNNKKVILENKMVWGFRYPGNDIYRNYNNDFFKIEQSDKLIIYSRKSVGFRGRLLTNYYFSKDYNSALLPLNKLYIHSQFQSNYCVLEKIKKSFKWPYDYSFRESKKGTFKILQVINECSKSLY